ncbi:MAG: ribbon-helix-helix domain-containing protein [Alphaproteobacteria bacterium]|nr:ribbon-helix-helix domain-containing protein [Alphaproteobacteria bacterium]
MEPGFMIKRSMTINGHRTSISLEQPFWQELQQMAKSRQIALSALVAEIDLNRSRRLAMGEKNGGLSSEIRLYVLNAALNKTQDHN